MMVSSPKVSLKNNRNDSPLISRSEVKRNPLMAQRMEKIELRDDSLNPSKIVNTLA